MSRTTFKTIVLIGLCGLSTNCQSSRENSTENNYVRFVGDINKDSVLDNPSFELCNGEDRTVQYFNTGEGFRYKGEKPALIAKFKEVFGPYGKSKGENGYVRIRFIINCKGKAGRFRILASDLDYREKEFDKGITDQLISIVQGLEGWEVLRQNDYTLDYYQYLIFKFENGHLAQILP